jgi:type II secretory pathway pseudopilin PulG
MNTASTARKHRTRAAFTLLEMTIVIMLLIVLTGIGMYSGGAYRTWQLGREAAEQLRNVQTAQRMYLADHPTANVSTLTAAVLIPYLPDRATAIPTVKSLEGGTLSIRLNVFPPVVDNGSGTAYDPSGNPRDSLWDTGE